MIDFKREHELKQSKLKERVECPFCGKSRVSGSCKYLHRYYCQYCKRYFWTDMNYANGCYFEYMCNGNCETCERQLEDKV